MEAYERLLKYVKISSQSDETSGCTPSSKGQWDVAKAVVEDMISIGIADARVDELCYVYGTIPASEGREQEPVIGLIAHMDTAPAFSGDGVKPRIIDNYDGGDIVLNEQLGIVMERKVFPALGDYEGCSLIVTDGTTLLGSDDKAGVSEILTAAERIINEKISHPTIRIAFTPDEEIGEGADHFDVKGFGADYAYTVDGGALGELEYENFNAASMHIIVHGNCIHPGEGKNRMKNASLIAMEYNSMLPPFETPAHTEGYEGFYHLLAVKGDEEKATLDYIIRDHDRIKFEERKRTAERITQYLNEKYGTGTIECELKDSYYNMREMVEPHMEIVERAREAFLKNQITPKVQPIRGGTDGARLSYMGLICPNLSTGGHNFHGKFEFIPIESMTAMTNVLISLVRGE